MPARAVAQRADTFYLDAHPSNRTALTLVKMSRRRTEDVLLDEVITVLKETTPFGTGVTDARALAALLRSHPGWSDSVEPNLELVVALVVAVVQDGYWRRAGPQMLARFGHRPKERLLKTREAAFWLVGLGKYPDSPEGRFESLPGRPTLETICRTYGPRAPRSREAARRKAIRGALATLASGAPNDRSNWNQSKGRIRDVAIDLIATVRTFPKALPIENARYIESRWRENDRRSAVSQFSTTASLAVQGPSGSNTRERSTKARAAPPPHDHNASPVRVDDRLQQPLLGHVANLLAATEQLLPLVISRSAASTLWSYATIADPAYAEELGQALRDDWDSRRGFVHAVRLLDAHASLRETYDGRRLLRNVNESLERHLWLNELGVVEHSLGPIRFLLRQPLGLDPEHFANAARNNPITSDLYAQWDALIHAPGPLFAPFAAAAGTLARARMLSNLWTFQGALSPFVPDEAQVPIDLKSMADFDLSVLVFEPNGTERLPPGSAARICSSAHLALDHGEMLWVTHAPSALRAIYEDTPPQTRPGEYISYIFDEDESATAGTDAD